MNHIKLARPGSFIIGSGFHRDGWPYVMKSLEPLLDDSGIAFDDFVERSFTYSLKKHPYDEPWVGVFHHPPHTDKWSIGGNHSLQKITQLDVWKRSAEHLKAGIALSEYHAAWLRDILDVDVHVAYHPVPEPDVKFSESAYLKRRKKLIVQIGWYLRNTDAIFQLPPAPGWDKCKIRYNVDYIRAYDDYIIGYWEWHGGRPHYGKVREMGRQPNVYYDKLLSSSVVFTEVFDASANNVVLDCIARNTPLLINRHAAAREYLGDDYPLFYDSLEHAVTLLNDHDIIMGHRYLEALDKSRFGIDVFLKKISDIAGSVNDDPAPRWRKNGVIVKGCSSHTFGHYVIPRHDDLELTPDSRRSCEFIRAAGGNSVEYTSLQKGKYEKPPGFRLLHSRTAYSTVDFKAKPDDRLVLLSDIFDDVSIPNCVDYLVITASDTTVRSGFYEYLNKLLTGDNSLVLDSGSGSGSGSEMSCFVIPRSSISRVKLYVDLIYTCTPYRHHLAWVLDMIGDTARMRCPFLHTTPTDDVFDEKYIDHNTSRSDYVKKRRVADDRRINVVSWMGNTHRSGWFYAIDSLVPLQHPDGVVLDGFVEESFCWSDNKKKIGTVPYNKPWIGFIHCPQNMPKWFQYNQSPQSLFKLPEWQDSLEHCKGLFCLSNYHRRWLAEQLDVPVVSLVHPTEIPNRKFDPSKFIKTKRIIQIGYWLRRLHSIYQLPTRTMDKVHLLVPWIAKMLPVEAKELGLSIDYDGARQIDFLSNREYDDVLSSSIVFLHLYDSSANNAVIECIARNTPVLVNRHPAVEEYLGVDYPLFFNDLEHAADLAEDLDAVVSAYEYLARMSKDQLSQEYFRESVCQSEIYQNLPQL